LPTVKREDAEQHGGVNGRRTVQSKGLARALAGHHVGCNRSGDLELMIVRETC
jgi:uncharacterized Zn-binding protein involved in type VI secretion